MSLPACRSVPETSSRSGTWPSLIERAVQTVNEWVPGQRGAKVTVVGGGKEVISGALQVKPVLVWLMVVDGDALSESCSQPPPCSLEPD